MKPKAKKRCRKHKYKPTTVSYFGMWKRQVPYRNEKQLEHENKCVQRILREVEIDEINNDKH